MEAKSHVLKRPKRKLCYITKKESPSKKWEGNLSLRDIDGMFDDLGSSSHDDIIPPSPPLQLFHSARNQSEGEISPVTQEGRPTTKHPGPGGNVLYPARSLSPELHIDVNIPFEVRGPIKTSSPIEDSVVGEAVGKEDNERALVVPQILNFEEAKTDRLNAPNLQFNGHVTKERDDGELESPPSKITLSSHKKRVSKSCEGIHSVKEKTPKKNQTPALEVKFKTPRQGNPEPPVSSLKQNPEVFSGEKNSGKHRQSSVEKSTHGKKDIEDFLQKVRDAKRTKPTCSRGLQSLAKVPAPPAEPEDEFLILDDDAPLFYIPCKASNRRRQWQKETKADHSTSDKDSTEMGMRESPAETVQNKEEPGESNPKDGAQPLNQKLKKSKGKEKNNEVTKPENDKVELFSLEDLPAGNVEQEKPNKKKYPSKERDKGSRPPDEGTHTQKMKKITENFSEAKSSKSSKDGKENVKTSRAKSSKRSVEAGNEPNVSSKRHAASEDLSSLSKKETVGSRAQTPKAKRNKLPVVSGGSSFEDSQVPGKRKRKQPGQWWMSCPQSSEPTEDKHLELKKSRQNNKELNAAGPSPGKAKKDRVLKRKSQKLCAPSPNNNTNTAEEKKTKKNKSRITRGEAPDEIQTGGVFKVTVEEQVEDQDLQDVQQQDEVFTQRDRSLSTGKLVFQRVYHHVSNEKAPSIQTSASPRRPMQQLREGNSEKRRKKPPGNWWLVNDIPECSSSQPQLQQKRPKSRKESKKHPKQSSSHRLGSPKNGNMAASSKPLGRVSTVLQDIKPTSAPKTVKRSLATFKDIFTSATETGSVKSRDTSQNNTRNDSEDVRAVLQNHHNPSDSKCLSDNVLKELKSGPSSMIQLEQYEENEDLNLPSSRVQAVLSMADLCGPPLKPLVLQPKDKANLTEWFRSLWPTHAPNAAEMTANQFDWYFYQDRAIGFLLDMNCGSASIGRILLGSYMKKPLWVDHNASTVFNILTSSVKVVIDSRESRFDAGQCFTVQCGRAYSVQNVTAQPAVLYFTRMLEDSSD